MSLLRARALARSLRSLAAGCALAPPSTGAAAASARRRPRSRRLMRRGAGCESDRPNLRVPTAHWGPRGATAAAPGA